MKTSKGPTESHIPDPTENSCRVEAMAVTQADDGIRPLKLAVTLCAMNRLQKTIAKLRLRLEALDRGVLPPLVI